MTIDCSSPIATQVCVCQVEIRHSVGIKGMPDIPGLKSAERYGYELS
jgi:hypothetical protein